MYEHLVTNVHHREDREHAHYFTFDMTDTGEKDQIGVVSPHIIGAIETYLAQPHPPTPEEIALDIYTTWRNGIGWSMAPKSEELVAAIADAIRADREAAR